MSREPFCYPSVHDGGARTTSSASPRTSGFRCVCHSADRLSRRLGSLAPSACFGHRHGFRSCDVDHCCHPEGKPLRSLRAGGHSCVLQPVVAARGWCRSMLVDSTAPPSYQPVLRSLLKARDARAAAIRNGTPRRRFPSLCRWNSGRLRRKWA